MTQTLKDIDLEASERLFHSTGIIETDKERLAWHCWNSKIYMKGYRCPDMKIAFERALKMQKFGKSYNQIILSVGAMLQGKTVIFYYWEYGNGASLKKLREDIINATSELTSKVTLEYNNALREIKHEKSGGSVLFIQGNDSNFAEQRSQGISRDFYYDGDAVPQIALRRFRNVKDFAK